MILLIYSETLPVVFAILTFWIWKSHLWHLVQQYQFRVIYHFKVGLSFRLSVLSTVNGIENKITIGNRKQETSLILPLVHYLGHSEDQLYREYVEMSRCGVYTINENTTPLSRKQYNYLLANRIPYFWTENY